MTPSHDIDLDDEAGADEALDLATAGFAMRVLKVICAVTTDLAPEIVRGKRPSDRASVTRKLWFYTLNNWMSAKSIGALSGFNPAHINREVQQLLTWAEANAAFEEYLERFDAFVLSIPEIVGFSEDMVTEMVEEGRKILIFSQFTTMLQLIEDDLSKQKIPFVKLTGQTKKREDVINAFQSGQVPVFLISLKAGGVGLNLTAADTVIHYDPWWNPAAEDQASDRAWRIGQDKPVFVYKLITNQSIEEKIIALQKNKADLAASILSHDKEHQVKLSEEDVLQLFERF